MTLKEVILSYGEKILNGADGMRPPIEVDARGFFNHTLYIHFDTIGAQATTMDFFIDIMTPSCYVNNKGNALPITQKLGTVDFTATAGPYDTLIPFGGNAVVSAILPGAVFYTYRIWCRNNAPLGGDPSVTLKGVSLTMIRNDETAIKIEKIGG